MQARNQDFLWGGSFKWSLGPNTCRGSGGVTPGKFLKNEYPFWCILSHFHKPLPDFFLKLTSILMHFEVFWQVTPGKFLTNGYPLWCILRYFFRRQPWKFFWHLHPFWCILKYFWTSSLENKKNWYPFWCIFCHFHKPLPEFFVVEKLTSILMHFEVFWQVIPGKVLKCLCIFVRHPWKIFKK